MLMTSIFQKSEQKSYSENWNKNYYIFQIDIKFKTRIWFSKII